MEQFLSKAWPWVLSTIFGMGAGIGSARVIAKNQEDRIQKVEKVLSSNMLTRNEHTLLCAKIHAETALQNKIIIDEALERLGDRLMEKIEKLHNKE